MYSDDRRYHVRELTRLKDELERLSESVRSRLQDLSDDDYDNTRDSRRRLAECRGFIEEAAEALASAVEQLPEGQQRKPLPRF